MRSVTPRELRQPTRFIRIGTSNPRLLAIVSASPHFNSRGLRLRSASIDNGDLSKNISVQPFFIGN